MGIDWQLTKQQLGDVGPLRHNPYVIKVCQTCQTPEKRRYKGGTKPTAPYHCNKCIANRPTKKQASSEGAKKGWQDPQYRLQIQTNSKSNWQDPNLVARMSKWGYKKVKGKKKLKFIFERQSNQKHEIDRQ
jgi:hypothetical protein